MLTRYLAPALATALIGLATGVKSCFQSPLTVNKDEHITYSVSTLDFRAPWFLISHNARNNRRTKSKNQL